MRVKKDVIIFDLDGTLLKSAPSIVHSLQKTQEHFNIDVWEFEDLTFAIGPPLEENLNAIGISDNDIEEALACYRKHYSEFVFTKESLYDGVEDMLKDLKQRGKRLAIGTSKLESVAIDVLEQIGIAGYFELIAGHDNDDSGAGCRNSKGEVLAYVIEQFGCSVEDAILIGDRKFDIIGAKEVGLACVGVLYGYGSLDELEEHEPEFILGGISEITSLIE